MHTFWSPALHECGWYREFCSPFAAPQRFCLRRPFIARVVLF